jgi:hypothetical protein
MREDLAADTPMPHPAMGTSVVAVPSQRRVGTSAETSTADTVAAVPIMEVAGITVAGDMAQALDSASASIRLMGMLRRSAVPRDSMTSTASGISIPVAPFHIERCP